MSSDASSPCQAVERAIALLSVLLYQSEYGESSPDSDENGFMDQ